MQPIKEAAAEDREAKEFTILQLIPALPGWGAVWGTREEPAQGEPGYFTEPVVCWALVEATDGHRFVTAMAPDLDTSELKLMLDWMQLASTKRTENQPHLP